MVRLAWRLQRGGLIAIGGFAAVVAFVQVSGYTAVAGSTPVARHAFGMQMSVLGRQLSYLLPPPLHPDTVGGYLQWRLYGLMAIVVAVWAVLAAAGAARGDEARGLVESQLAAGVSRAWMIGARIFTFAGAVTVMAAVTAAFGGLGAVTGHEPISFAGLIWEGGNVVALATCLYTLCLLVVQLIPDHRSAAAMSGLLVTILFLENGVARSAAWLAPAAVVSPFHYYDLSRPVDPGGAVNPAAIAVLLATATGFALLALMAFTRRDIGRSVLDRAARDGNAPQRSGATAGASPWLRVPVLADVYETRAGLVAWIAAAVLLTAFMTSIARTITQVIRGTPGLDAYRSALNDKGDITVAVMSLVVLGLAQAVVIVFAIAQVSRWANQDADGRLELILSQPTSRSRVVLSRGAGLVLGLCLISAAIVSTLATAALTQHAAIGLAGALEAAALLMALGLAFGGVGAMLIGRQPRLAVTILGIYAGLAYIIQQFGPLARWPSWVLGISVLRLGGQPLTGHVNWAELGAMAALAGAGFGAAIITMQRREVGR